MKSRDLSNNVPCERMRLEYSSTVFVVLFFLNKMIPKEKEKKKRTATVLSANIYIVICNTVEMLKRGNVICLLREK